ncbi:MAG: hypothetical protein ACLFVE_12730 [Chitinispirillaceae bacterium]
MISSFKSLNFLSHAELLDSAREILDSVPDTCINASACLIKATETCLAEFRNNLSRCRALSLWPIIDESEQKRYALWEKIADKLDDNLNIFIVDEYSILKKIGLTKETAAHEIPSYDASWMLLDKSKAFPIGRYSIGHFWKPALMNKLISRLTDPSNSALCQKAGIMSLVENLAKVEKSLKQQIKSLPDKQMVPRLRNSRYHLLSKLKILYYSKEEQSRITCKTCRYLNAGILFEDRFRTLQQIKNLETFSLDQLKLSQLADLVQSRAAIFFENESNDILEMLYHEFHPVFMKTLDAFRSHPLWDQFEKGEHDFYKESLLLMDKVFNHITCSNEEDPQVWEKHVHSEEFKRADYLFRYGRDDNRPLDWEPGEIMNEEVFRTILDRWNASGCTRHLEALDASDLHRNCMNLNRTVREYAGFIRESQPRADIEILRRYRYELSDIVKFM